MGVCEQLVQFEHRYGQRRSAQQRADMARGDQEHLRFYQEGLAERKGRCFIATQVYGEGPETALLRQFRDQVLRALPFGRVFIYVYYRTDPSVCRVLDGRPQLTWVVRALLEPIVWMTARIVKSSRGGRKDG